MASPTVNDLLLDALKASSVLGEGQIASDEAITDARKALEGMLAQWSKQRWLVYVLNTYSLTADGRVSYTVGPGGDFDTPVRPNRVESVFFRQNTGENPYVVDYRVSIIEAREDYNRIRTKLLRSFPEYAFYESDWPLGNLFVWPIPIDLYTIFITVMHPLGQYQSLTDDMALPPEYRDAIVAGLAERLCIMYSRPISADLAAWAKVTLSVLRRANAQVPLIKMPTDLLRPGIYNPYADTTK